MKLKIEKKVTFFGVAFYFFQIFANSIGEEVSMVQEIAQEIIRSARKKRSAGYLFCP